jgi:hypothetical protein
MRGTIMRNLLRGAVLAALLAGAPLQAQEPSTTVPFSVSLRPVSIPGLPALQGFAAARWNGKWILATGRRAGLHTISADSRNPFPPQQANDSIYLVDPRAGTVHSASVRALSPRMMESLTVTNAQSYQDGDWLYLIGGYGAKAVTDSMRTMPYATGLYLPLLVPEVVRLKNPPVLPAAQASDARFRVTGGQLLKMNGLYYLAMGQLFDGVYSGDPGAFSQFLQVYTERISILSITPPALDPRSLADTFHLRVQIVDTLRQDPNDPGTSYHRRDLNVVGAFTPGGGRRIAVYGGVFVPGRNEGYRYPLYVDQDNRATVDSTFAQATSQYDCATLLLWDAATQTMHTVLFGGIGGYAFNADSNRYVPVSRLPFVSTVSVISVPPGGPTTQAAFLDSLPGLLGAEARIFLDTAVAADGMMDIVHLDSLASGDSTRVGWLYGGIRSSVPQTTDQEAQTSATSMLYEVWITRAPTPATLLPTGAGPRSGMTGMGGASSPPASPRGG